MPRTADGPRLRQRGGIWYIHWREAGQPMRRSTGEALRHRAEKKLAEFLLATETERGVPTIANVLERYMREHVYAHTARPERAEGARDILVKAVGRLPVNQFTADKQRRYIENRMAGRYGRQVKSPTIRRELNVLIAAINHARKNQRINPAQIPHIALPPDGAPRDLWLTEDEADFWLAVAKKVGDRAYVFSAIALYAAARKHAIETLSWSQQVDMVRRRIDFNPPGRRQTKKRRPAVPMADELHAVLEEAYARRTNDWVLWSPGAVRKTMSTVATEAVKLAREYPTRFPDPEKFARVTPHTLRHTCATLMAQAGVDMWEIAGMLGDTLATVERNYAHHHPDHLRGAANWRSRRAGNDPGNEKPLTPGDDTRHLSTPSEWKH